jgi:hypothetical protein
VVVQHWSEAEAVEEQRHWGAEVLVTHLTSQRLAPGRLGLVTPPTVGTAQHS